MRERALSAWLPALLMAWSAFALGCGSPNLGVRTTEKASMAPFSGPELGDEASFQAEDFAKKKFGTEISGGWLMSQKGASISQHFFALRGGTYEVRVAAQGAQAQYWPALRVSLDGASGEIKFVDSTAVNDYVFQLHMTSGPHELTLLHGNADVNGGPDLLLDMVTIKLLSSNEPARLPSAGSPPVGGSGSGTQLRWAPPNMAGARTIQLGTGFESRELDGNVDYIVKMPNTKKVGGTVLTGGRNIVIIGGHVTIPWRRYEGSQTHNYLRSFFFEYTKGTVHVEGVLIDSSGGMEQDGIAIRAPEAIVQVENVRMEDLKGTEPTMHADFIQPWGGVRELRVDRFTGNSNYQGFFLVGDSGHVGRVEMHNVNVRADSNPTGKGGYMLWWGQGYPALISNFFIQPKPGGSLFKSVAPETGDTQACWNFVTGCAMKGAPAQDFVPKGSVGIGYRSPGYVGSGGQPPSTTTPTSPTSPTPAPTPTAGRPIAVQ